MSDGTKYEDDTVYGARKKKFEDSLAAGPINPLCIYTLLVSGIFDRISQRGHSSIGDFTNTREGPKKDRVCPQTNVSFRFNYYYTVT